MAQQNPFFLLDEEPQTPAPAGKPGGLAPGNPFALLDELEEQQRRRMQAAQEAAKKTTPDAAAESAKAAQATGVPPSVLAGASPAAQEKLKTSTLPVDAVQQQAPTLAEWSTNPTNAAVAADDMAEMGFLEWVLKAPSRAFLQQRNRYLYSELRYKEVVGHTLTQAERDLMNSYKFHAELGGNLSANSFFAKATTGAGRQIAQFVEPAKYAIAGGLTTGGIGAVGGSVLPGAGTAAGAISGATIGARAGSLYGRVKSETIQESVGIADELSTIRDENGKPLDPQVIQAASLVGGALAGGLGVIGLDAVLKRTPGLDKLVGIGKGPARTQALKTILRNPTTRAALVRFIKQYGGGLIEQVGEEVAQRAVSITAEELAKAASGPEFDKLQRGGADILGELADEAINAIPEFAFGSGPGPTLNLVRDIHAAKQAEQAVTFFTALGEGAEQSKTLQRLPSAFREFVKAETDKEGGVKEVYAPADTWRVYWQGKGVDPAAMATQVTGRADAMEVADREGVLRIETADYATNLAGTEHNAFFVNELRLRDPDAMNGRESAAFKETVVAAQAKLAELQAGERETPVAQALSSISSQIEAQLVAANVPRETARIKAQAMVGVGVQAVRAGFDPYKVFESYGLRVTRARAADYTTGASVLNQPPAGAAGGALEGAAAAQAGAGEAIGAPGIVPQGVEPGLALNASGESAASLEAISRQSGMRAAGKQFVVYDRAGRRRVLIGPDAVDYTPRAGETYGVEGPAGFELREDNGGRGPASPAQPSALGRAMGRLFQAGPGELAPVPASVQVDGPIGQANAQGIAAKFIGYQEGWEEAGIPTIAIYNVIGGALDGSTVDIDRLNEQGIPIPPTPPLLRYNQAAIARQPALKTWFGNSVVVDELGQPLTVFHGTTQVFNSFESERANLEADFGRGFYFSNNPEDTSENYAGIGPDLKQKIDLRAEQLADERGVEYNDAQARADAMKELVAHEGQVVPVFLKIENPAVLGGHNPTQLTYEVEYDDDGDVVSEGGTLLAFVEALREAAGRFYDAKVDEAIATLLEDGLDGIDLADAIAKLKEHDGLIYATDENGVHAVNEIIRQALEGVGFDGIVDHTVDVKFGSQRRLGQPMKGMDSDTTHFIAFAPTQMKSAIGNRGTYDPASTNILFQGEQDMLPPAGTVYFSKLVRVIDAIKQNKATGAQWKATIKGAKIGVSRDEWALTKMDDLHDDATYTKEELQRYIEVNKPEVETVMLGEPGVGGEATEAWDDDDVNELAQEIMDEMEQEAWQEFDDWDDYLGTASYHEETETEEVERIVEHDDEQQNLFAGDTVTEEVEVTRYYAAISGGMVKRRGRYGLQDRGEDEVLIDLGSFDTSEEAEEAAEKHIKEMDRDDFYETISERIREDLDWGDATRRAEEQLEQDRGPREGNTGGDVQYEQYILEPAPVPGSYREVFITTPPVPYISLTKDEIAKRTFKAKKGGPPITYATLTDEQKQDVDGLHSENEHRVGRGLSRTWKDGHDSYSKIENPIVRIRYNVRKTVTHQPGDPAIIEAGKAAEAERAAMMAKYDAANDESEFADKIASQALIETDALRLDELHEAITKGERAAQGEQVEGDPVFFIEEMQPPGEKQQPKMSPIFLDRWREIGFKWALHKAAAMGMKSVAWTTGDQQARRYSLAKTVDHIDYGPTAPGTPGTIGHTVERFATVSLRDGGSIVLQMDRDGIVRNIPSHYAGNRTYDQLINQPLTMIVGPELAQQIMTPDPTATVGPTGAEGTIDTQGLAVGGQGLKRLYDYDFKSVVQGIAAVKKLKGAVESVSIEVANDYAVEAHGNIGQYALDEWARSSATASTGKPWYVIDDLKRVVAQAGSYEEAYTWKTAHATQVSQQPALNLTPEMTQEILGGSSLFQPHRYVPKTAAEMETLTQQLAALVAAEQQRVPGSLFKAHVTAAGEVFVDRLDTATREPGSGTSMMRALLKWADDRNLQVSLDAQPSATPGGTVGLTRMYRDMGFVQNGSKGFYDAGSMGQLVRPSRSFRQRPKRGGEQPRGALAWGPNRQMNILLFEKADLSTFLHETGHFYLEVMGDLVDQLDALDPATLTREQQQVRTDYATILRHIGVNNRAQIGTANHELFARTFEAYLMEGKAPSIALRDAFAHFRAWLVSLYRSLTMLDAALSPDIRKVFDRMLATDDQIADAQQQGQLAPLFLTPEAAGMSHERFALYRDTIAQASQAATEELDQALAAEVQREQTAQWKAQKALVRAEVATAANLMPAYRALYAMRKGTQPNGEAMPVTEGTPETTPLKLSRALLIERFGEDRVKSLPRGIAGESGLDPDVVADMFGYGSGDALLTAITNVPPLQKFISAETERRMLHEHGSLLLDGTLADRAKLANANEMREHVLREELRALAMAERKARPIVSEAVDRERRERDYERRWFEAEAKLRIAIAEGHQQVEIDKLTKEVAALRTQMRSMPGRIRGALPTMKDARDAARIAIADTKVRDLNPATYWSRMRRASLAATEAAARQDFAEAVKQKTDEIIAMALFRETQRVKLDVEQRVRAAQKLGTPASLARLMKAGESYHDQVAGVLDRFDFADVPRTALDRRSDLHAWVKSMEAQGIPVNLPPELLNEARRTNYQNLTVNEVIGVTDGLKQIVHLSRLKNRLLANKAARDLKVVATGIADTIRARWPVLPTPDRVRTVKGERKRGIADIFVSHRKLASMIRELDGFVDGGPLWQAVMRPLNEAANREAEMNADATRRYSAIIERAYPGSEKRTLYHKSLVPAVGETMTKMERLMIAMNWGNEGNRDRVRRSHKWTDAQVQAVLDSLDLRDMTFVQDVLTLVGSYAGEIQAKSRRVSGVTLKMVEATPIVTAVGTFPGGYFPLKYDDRLSPKAASALDIEATGLARAAAFVHATTARGHEQARVETLDLPVLYDFGVISTHIAQVIHDLSHHEALIDVGRVLAHPEVRKAIYDTKGDLFEKAMRDTVRDVAFGDLPARSGVERALNHVRAGATVVGLAWNFTTAMLQWTGFFNSIVRLGGPLTGTKYLGAGFKTLLGSPKHMTRVVEQVYAKSLMMKNRAATQNRELNEIRNKVGVYSGQLSAWVEQGVETLSAGLATKQGVADSYFYFIQKAQQLVDVPTWLAAYEKAIDSGVDEDTAVALADQTVLDSQGGGQIKDLAGVQRGTAGMKLFTNFYSFFSVLYQQAVEARLAPKKNVLGIGRMAADYALLFIIPASASMLIREAMRPGDDDDEPLAERLIKANLTYLMGTMVGLREFGGAVEGYYGYEGPAGSRFFAAGSKLIKQVQQLELDEAAIKAFSEFAGVLFHFPAGQVNRTVTGIAALIEGRTQNPLAIVQGPPKD